MGSRGHEPQGHLPRALSVCRMSGPGGGYRVDSCGLGRKAWPGHGGRAQSLKSGLTQTSGPWTGHAPSLGFLSCKMRSWWLLGCVVRSTDSLNGNMSERCLAHSRCSISLNIGSGQKTVTSDTRAPAVLVALIAVWPCGRLLHGGPRITPLGSLPCPWLPRRPECPSAAALSVGYSSSACISVSSGSWREGLWEECSWPMG